MFYRKLLKQAWYISWKNKYLWFFGLFATLLGSGEIFRFSFDSQDSLIDYSAIKSTGVFNGNIFVKFAERMAENPIATLFLMFFLVLFVALIIFLVWLAVTSEIALVNNAALLIKNKKADFKSGLSKGKEKFWPVFWLDVINKSAVVFLIGVLSALLVSLDRVNPILQFIPFLIAFAFTIIFTFAIKYAIVFVVIKNQSFKQALKSGFDLFFKNWIVSVEMAILLFAISFLTGLLLLMAFMVVGIPMMFLAMVLYRLASAVGFWLIMVPALVLVLAAVLAAGSLLTTFKVSAWTGLLLELITGGGQSKILRIFNKSE